MPKMHISRTQTINAPKEEVLAVINDFHQWRPWSPWLVSDPEATVTIDEERKYQIWEGKRVGSGEMTILKSTDDQIDMDLTFLKPWKSQADVRFNLKANGDTTDLTWSMDGSLPWFMFWMKKMMVAILESDYDRGLSMLKEYIEEGQIHSKLDFIGEQDYPGSDYIAIRTDTTIDKMAAQMEIEFTQMMTYMADKQDNVNGLPFTIYHKWNFAKKKVSYTSGIPVKTYPSDLPKNMIKGNMPASKVYTIRHTGRWTHLGNAWTTIYTMHRNKEFKPIRGRHPFESYVNSPKVVSAEELISDINYPIR